MTMDYAALPPEINSHRMYAGPGAGSLLAAASAWSQLAAELNSAANSYQSVITGLQSEQWVGPTSALMAEAVKPYVSWMQSTATLAETSASNARQAAAVYETAFSAMVPPPQIAHNRAQLAMLVAHNLVGQNTAKIAATEAQYSQMWAQDATTMYQYASGSAAATKQAHYSSPPQTTNAAGTAKQHAAVSQATATAAGNGQSQMSQMISHMSTALNSLSSPSSSAAASSIADNPISDLFSAYGPIGGFLYDTLGLPYFGIGLAFFITGIENFEGLIGRPAAAVLPDAGAMSELPAAGLLGETSGTAIPASLASTAPVSAGMATATSVGKLAVPASWAGSTPITAATHAPEFVSEIVEHESAAAPGMIGGIPGAGAGRNQSGNGPRYGMKPSVVTRPPSAG